MISRIYFITIAFLPANLYGAEQSEIGRISRTEDNPYVIYSVDVSKEWTIVVHKRKLVSGIHEVDGYYLNKATNNIDKNLGIMQSVGWLSSLRQLHKQNTILSLDQAKELGAIYDEKQRKKLRNCHIAFSAIMILGTVVVINEIINILHRM